MALYVSQVDSPAPGPGDIAAAAMLITAGIWWTWDHYTQPGYTTIADPGVAYGSMNSDSEAEKDTNGVEVPKEGKYAPKEPLRKDKDGNHVIDEEAQGTDHTQLGTKEGRKGSYQQGREFDHNGNPVRDVDHTDHGRPGTHTNPHQHNWKPSKTGGTYQRGGPEPLK